MSFQVTLNKQKINFQNVPLKFNTERHTSIFSQKNNKTLEETIKHKKYAIFDTEIRHKYKDFLSVPLGEFLLGLKDNNDSFYIRFLNLYGDLEYSTFSISCYNFLDKKGVYIYTIGPDINYVGRCKDSMRKRINQGYGKIHPKNCFRDGQSTNCRLNALITNSSKQVSLWLHEMEDETSITELETNLILSYKPQWNIRK